MELKKAPIGKTALLITMGLLLVFLFPSIARSQPDTISGTITYTGTATGTILVAAFTSWPVPDGPAGWVTIANPGPYAISGLAPGSYYVFAYLDSNGNWNPDPSEPWGIYGGSQNPTAVPAGSTDIDFTLFEEYRLYLPLIFKDH